MENNTLKQLPDTPRDRYQLATKKFVTQQLVEQYPCRLSNANKALLYSIACPAGIIIRAVNYTRKITYKL
jgi:hypothetical protein